MTEVYQRKMTTMDNHAVFIGLSLFDWEFHPYRRWSPIGSDRGGLQNIHLHVLIIRWFSNEKNISKGAFITSLWKHLHSILWSQNILSCVTSILGTGKTWRSLSGMSSALRPRTPKTRVLWRSWWASAIMWSHKENPSVDIHIGGHWTPQWIAT